MEWTIGVSSVFVENRADTNCPSDIRPAEGVDSRPSVLHPCNDKGFVLDRIAGLEAGGGTVMAPAMEEGYEVLRGAIAKLKHMIILTDGISAPGDFEGIAQAMAADRITVSTVAMGADADQQLLEDIARIGNGRYYVADDPAQVPQIFAKETVTASKSASNEQPFSPTVIRPTQVLSDISLDVAPFLLGYVITRPKPTAEVILATESGDPLLAWWRYGLGMSVAFTSDAKARWAAEWLSWPQFAQFWAQVARHALRKAEAKGTVVQVERKGRKAVVTLDAIEPSGKYLNRAQTELILVDPQLAARELEMAQVVPGRYQAEFEAARPGSYQLRFTQSKGGQLIGQQSRGLAVGYPDELRLRATNTDLLRSIAEITAGHNDVKAEEVFDSPSRTVPRTTPLWPYLVTVPTEPIEAVVAAADDARSGLEELAELTKKQDNKELRELVQQLAQKIDEMKQPGVDVKEALAKLSEMQASIATQQALYNVGMVDAQMTSLGGAMASTQSLESAGQSLQQQKYDKAAAALEQAEAKFERKEAKNLKEKLKKAALAQGEAGLGELSETTAEMADTLDEGQAFRDSARKLAKLARAQGRRKQINDLLTLLSNKLCECKGNCQKNGGPKVLARKKSTRPSSTWGRSTSGNVDGDKTKLDSERKRDQVQGQADEGPSEVETTHSPEGHQLATRSYRENYAKYRRKTEAALNSEPIPLGHRQTIRRYFELIRPQGEEVEKSAVKPQAAGKK